MHLSILFAVISVEFNAGDEVLTRYSASIDIGDEIEVKWNSTTATVHIKKARDTVRKEI
jgi:ribosomal 50S subunit-recycling heat shock protein